MKIASFVLRNSFRSILGLNLLLFAARLPAAQAADVQRFLLEKGLQNVQTDASTILADANNGVIFEASLNATGTSLVQSATVLLPGGTSVALPADGLSGFKLKKKYDKPSTLDKNFPNGTYTLTTRATDDGVRTVSLTLTGDLYPKPPHCLNFTAAQAIDSGAYFLFAWDAFEGGTANDFVQLHIEDAQGNKVWETPDPGEPGALDGLANSILMPPGSLDPGKTYDALLYFAKASTHNTTSYPGALLFAAYYQRTKFTIQTTTPVSQSPVKTVSLLKTRRFDQVDATAPVLASSKTFNFDLFLDVRSSANVTNATLTVSGGKPQDLKPATGYTSFSLSGDAVTLADLDTAYPAGAYQVALTPPPSGSKGISVTMPVDAFPEPPHLPALPEQVDPHQDLLVSWGPFVGGTSTDFIQLHIEDADGNKVWETPDFGKTGALPGTALSAVVPADSLAAGQSYLARVVFQKNAVLDFTTEPGALEMVSFASRTSFNLATTGAAATAVTLASPQVDAGGVFSMRAQGTPGQKFRVETSGDLKTWAPISTNTIPSSGGISVGDTASRGSSDRYYRAASLP